MNLLLSTHLTMIMMMMIILIMMSLSTDHQDGSVVTVARSLCIGKAWI